MWSRTFCAIDSNVSRAVVPRCVVRSRCDRTRHSSTEGLHQQLPRLSDVAEALPRSQIRKIMELAWQAERAGRKVYHLEVGQPDLPAPDAAVEATRAALIDPVALRYCSNAGEMRTREAVANAVERRTGCKTAAEDILVSVGVNGGMAVVFSALLGVGDEILVPDPLWPNVDMASRLFGGIPVKYRMPADRGFLPDLGEMEALLTPRTKAIYVCSPSNPTGKVIAAEMMDAMIHLCRRHGIFLISDEIYGQIMFDGRPALSCLSSPTMGEASEHVIWLGGVSKAYAMTGFRVGFVRAPRRVISLLEKNQEALFSCGVPFAQRGAAAALAEASDSVVSNAVSTYSRRRDLALGALAEAGLDMPSVLIPEGAFYMLVPCAAPGPDCSEEVALALLDAEDVACAPGGGFGREAENFLRLSFATADEDVLEGTRRLARFLLRRGAKDWWPGSLRIAN